MARNRAVHARWIAMLVAIGVALAMWGGLTGAQEGDAQVRVVHAGHGIGAVDVYIDGDLAIEALEYGDATEYLPLAPDEYDVQVTAAGGDPAEALIDATFMLDAGTPHTLVAIGPADMADIIVVVDDHNGPADGMARLSLVNATSDSIAISLSQADGTVLIDDVQFADASDYVELEAGAHDLVVTSVDIEGEVASISGFSAEPGTTYSVFTMGVEGDYRAETFVDAVGSAPEPTQPPAATETPASAPPTATEPASGASPTATEPASGASPTATTAGSTPASPGTTPTARATAVTTAVSETATPTRGTAQPAATATVIPSLPATGEGGSSGGDGPAGWLFIVVPLALLAGAVAWRFGNAFPGGRA